MIYHELNAPHMACECGGEMHKIGAIPQTAQDQANVDDDTYVCPECGKFKSADADIFPDDPNTVNIYV